MNEILVVNDLTKRFDGRAVLKPASFSVGEGSTLGIVGESGSGKTTLVRALLRAIDPDSGSARYRNAAGWHDLATLTQRALKPLRRELSMVFQDPQASLNPRMTVLETLEEPLIVHGLGNRSERRAAVLTMLERVKLEADALTRFPHAFSGGQRQRIGIARALITDPRLVVLDESVAALDVSVQAQILELLKDLQAERGLTYLFVAHDLAVVRQFCDEVLVLYRGRIVERGPVERVFETPSHDYTRLLLSAIPSIDPDTPLSPLDRASLSLDE